LSAILAEPLFPVQRINLQASGRGYTLLMHAVTTGNAELVKLLIEHGADPNVGETYKGYQAVDMIRLSQEAGCHGDFHEIGQLLVSAGVDAMKLPENRFMFTGKYP
jgi:hypothetical protein